MTSTRQVALTEAELIERVRHPVPDDMQRRFSELIASREAERLTPLELDEFIRLSDQIEYLQAERLGYLAELARLRKRSVREIMSDLGIACPVSHD